MVEDLDMKNSFSADSKMVIGLFAISFQRSGWMVTLLWEAGMGVEDIIIFKK